jgi:hypothetical protein
MAENSYTQQGTDGGVIATIPRGVKLWVMGLLGSATILLAAGLVMASLTKGVPVPWAPPALVVALGLAAIVGASKTSSA